MANKINKVSNETREKIRKKSVLNLPNRIIGNPELVKQAFTGLVIDSNNSALGEIDRVVDEVNAEFETYAPLKESVENLINDKVVQGIIATDIEAKLNAKEQEYAPRLTSLEQNKADIDYVDAKVSAVASGSPKGTYPNLSALQSAIPDGDNNIYITSNNGHWNYYDFNTNEWKSGGVYQTRVRELVETEFIEPINTINYLINGFKEIRGNKSLSISPSDLEIASWYVNETVKNEIIWENGKPYLIKRVDKHVYDGSENWYKSSQGYFRFQTTEGSSARVPVPTLDETNSDTIRTDIRSDLYEVGTSRDIVNNTDDKIFTVNIKYPVATPYITYIRDNSLAEVSDLKAYLSTNNLVIYYEVQEEVIPIELTPEMTYVVNPVIKVETTKGQLIEIQIQETLKANDETFDFIDSDFILHKRVDGTETRPANVNVSFEEDLIMENGDVLYLESDTQTLPILLVEYEVNIYNDIQSLEKRVKMLEDGEVVVDLQEIYDEIEDINNRIDDLQTSGSDIIVKPYAITALEEARSKNIDFATNTNFTFVAMTDTHDQAYIPHMIDCIIAYERTYGNLDCVMHHGDLVNGNINLLSHKLQLLKVIKQIQKLTCPVLIAVGNHDVNASTSSPNVEPLLDDGWHSVALKPFSSRIKMNFDSQNKNSRYYYTDWENQKIRVITLDAVWGNYMNSANWWGYSDRQVEWLATEALDFSDKNDKNAWAVIIQSHMPAREEVNYYPYEIKNDTVIENILKAFVNGTSYNGYDFTSQGQMEVIMWVCGHGHLDILHKPADLYWHYVMTTTGHHIPRTSIPTHLQDKDYVFNPDKTINTINEFAFDIFNVDRENRKVTITRIGAGEDREFTY